MVPGRTDVRAAGLQLYGGRDPLDVPLYTIGDAARYLGIAASTAQSWCRGRDFGGERHFHPVIKPAGVGAVPLSFTNLTELHVLSVLREKHVPLPRIRDALAYLREVYGVLSPLAQADLSTANREIYADVVGQLVGAPSGQLEMRQVTERYLERIERDEQGLLRRLFPIFGRGASRAVAIDPRRRFGRPCLTARGIETWVVASRKRAGEPTEEIAEDLDLREEDVMEALRFEQADQAA